VKGWDTYVGWHDAEGVKEFLMPDGSIRRGVLILDDSWWDGEETIPIYHVRFEGEEATASYESLHIKGWRDADQT